MNIESMIRIWPVTIRAGLDMARIAPGKMWIREKEIRRKLE
jgi:hypothetical protein